MNGFDENEPPLRGSKKPHGCHGGRMVGVFFFQDKLIRVYRYVSGGLIWGAN